MSDKELRIGLKHYWMSDEASFVYGAGRMIVSQEGNVEYVDNHSGHYIPNPDQFQQSLNLLSYLNITFLYKDYVVMKRKYCKLDDRWDLSFELYDLDGQTYDYYRQETYT